MKHYPQLLSLMVLFAATIALALDSSEANETDSWDRYRVLAERNIFVRDRGVLSESRPVSKQIVKVVHDDTDKDLVLTAIAQRGREYIAFVENTRSGETIKVRPGDPIGKGKLVKITLNYVEYEREGTTTRIEFGSSLVGLTAGSETPGASADPSSSADATDANTSAILARMRKRREQEAKE